MLFTLVCLVYPLRNGSPTAPIFIRVSARPTCIINVAQFVRGQAGIRVAITLESTPDSGKNGGLRAGPVVHRL